MLISAGIGETARRVHRQSVGRSDAGVADVDADVLVLLLVSDPPIVRLLPPAPPRSCPSSDTEPLPVTLKAPVGGDLRAVLQKEMAGDGGQAGQRAVAAERAGVGDARIRAVELQRAIDRRDLAALEFQERVVSRKTVPVSTPAVPNPAAALATFRVAWTVALPSMLISLVVGRARPPVHRQSVGRSDAGVADRRRRCRWCRCWSASRRSSGCCRRRRRDCPRQATAAAAADRNVSADRLGYPGS